MRFVPGVIPVHMRGNADYGELGGIKIGKQRSRRALHSSKPQLCRNATIHISAPTLTSPNFKRILAVWLVGTGCVFPQPIVHNGARIAHSTPVGFASSRHWPSRVPVGD